MEDTKRSVSRMRIHYVVNARVPHTRAYGIQIAKMCEAFIESGVDITLVAPRTFASQGSVKNVNELRVDVRAVFLPGLDGYRGGKIAFIVSSLIFMMMSFVYLLREKLLGRLEIIYTVDMDTFSYALLPYLGVPVFAEMHTSKSGGIANKLFFKKVRGVIATNTEIRDALAFSFPKVRTLVEANGVDIEQFEHVPSKAEARHKLDLLTGIRIALYAGRFYDWKGLYILVRACAHAPDIEFFVVGGGEDLFKRVTGATEIPSNLHIMGEYKNSEIPLWLAAADTLLLLGTKSSERSFRETSPMKTYEYMEAKRPVIASRTPALESLVTGEEVLFYEPDNAEDLVRAIREGMEHTASVKNMVTLAEEKARIHSWENRAERIKKFISSSV